MCKTYEPSTHRQACDLLSEPFQLPLCTCSLSLDAASASCTSCHSLVLCLQAFGLKRRRQGQMIRLMSVSKPVRTPAVVFASAT